GGRFRGRDGELRDVETRIAAAIARQLMLDVGANASPSPGTQNAAAYDLYLRGRHHWNRRSPDSMRRAVENLSAAIALDAEFALAHAGLAEAYVGLGSRDLLRGNQEFELARAAALRAIFIDDSISAAHTAIAALAEIHDWKWAEAEAEHIHAVALDPT